MEGNPSQFGTTSSHLLPFRFLGQPALHTENAPHQLRASSTRAQQHSSLLRNKQPAFYAGCNQSDSHNSLLAV
eukprot:1449166-Pleurochrysis_carterae.AAC.1